MNTKAYGVIVLMLAVAIGGIYVYKTKISSTTVQNQVSYVIKSVRFLSAGEFEFVLQDDTRMSGRLQGGVSPEAKDDLMTLLHSVERGRIVVLNCQHAGMSTVDVFLVVKGGGIWSKEINLWDWLVQRKLSYRGTKDSLKTKDRK